MRRFIIERELPEIGSAERETLRGAAAKSNEVLAQLAPDVSGSNPMSRPTRRSASIWPRARR